MTINKNLFFGRRCLGVVLLTCFFSIIASSTAYAEEERRFFINPFFSLLQKLDEIDQRLIDQEQAISAVFLELDNRTMELGEGINAVDTKVEGLRDFVSLLAETILPSEVLVNCSNGETITDVLNTYANSTAPLTINITGVCNESVVIFRDNVTLMAASEGAEIFFDGPVVGTVTLSRGASNITINGLTISGGDMGILATNNSQLIANGVIVKDAVSGIVSINNSTIGVTSSTIDNTNSAFVATRLGYGNLSNTTITNSNTGVVASYSSVVYLSTINPFGQSTNGVTIIGNNSGVGAYANQGGRVLSNSSTLQNLTIGVYAILQGSAHLTATTVENSTLGVYARRNTSLSFNSDNIFNFNQFGIQCHEDAAYLVGGAPDTFPGTFTGNGINILGCVDY